MEQFIPPEAYNYIPKGDSVFISLKSQIVRFIFYKTQFTDFELDQISQFQSYIRNIGQNPDIIPKEELLRILIGCKFSLIKSFSALELSLAWRSSTFPSGLTSLFCKVEGLLNSGSIYIHGRDHKYRPLIVLNAGRLDMERYSIEDYTNLLCYILEYTVTQLMLPGHIENWIILTDLNNQSLTSLPLSQLKAIIGTLQNNYRCRMIVNYVVNSPKSLKFMWAMIKNFIEPHTVHKVRILSSSSAVEMKTHFNPYQYEEKYGGLAPNLSSNFWPPVLPPGPFDPNETSSSKLPERESVEVRYSKLSEDVFHSFSILSDVNEVKEQSNHLSSGRQTIYYDAMSRLSESSRIRSDSRSLSETNSCCVLKCSLF